MTDDSRKPEAQPEELSEEQLDQVAGGLTLFRSVVNHEEQLTGGQVTSLDTTLNTSTTLKTGTTLTDPGSLL